MENTNIRCYVNLADHTDLIDENKITAYFKERSIIDFKIIKTRVDSGVELFDSGYVELLHVEDVLQQLCDKLKPHQTDFNLLCSEINFSVKRIEVVINIHNNQIPSIYLNKNILEFLNFNNLEIEFDMYYIS